MSKETIQITDAMRQRIKGNPVLPKYVERLPIVIRELGIPPENYSADVERARNALSLINDIAEGRITSISRTELDKKMMPYSDEELAVIGIRVGRDVMEIASEDERRAFQEAVVSEEQFGGIGIKSHRLKTLFEGVAGELKGVREILGVGNQEKRRDGNAR